MNKPAPWYFALLSGFLASGTAIAIGEFSAGIAGGAPSIITAYGNSFINSTLVPNRLRDWSIDNIGTAQKPLLVAGVVITILLVGILLGWLTCWLGSPKRKGFFKRLSRFRLFIAGAVISIFGVTAGLSLSNSVGSSNVHAALTAIFAAGLSYLVLVALIYLAEGRLKPFDSRITRQPESETRRNFLVGALATALTATVGSFIGKRLVDFNRSQQSIDIASSLIQEIAPNRNSIKGNAMAATNFDDITGLSKYITPNKNFYLIDTALVKPSVKLESWSLKVKGLVKNELELSYRELLEMGLVEELVTLSCVSNSIGGSLVGNAIWRGVPLKKILDEAGATISPDTQVVGRSIDRWTGGFPTQLVYQPDRVSLVAVEMNGEPLPRDHGFPARLVISGIYGYVSATKWLTEIEIAPMSFEPYWIPRGWSKEGPVKTQSKIDVPRAFSKLPPGTHAIAGVAWAPSRGIQKVEVNIAKVTKGVLAETPWMEAELSHDLTDNSWRQWHFAWNAQEVGQFELRVRATDGTGETQTPIVTAPKPNGASGWDRTRVTVRA